MVPTTSTAFEAILATARTAAAAGDTVQARRYFRNASEIDPASIEAWLGLAATSAVLHERRGLYERALALDPGCREAHDGIAQIEALLATGALLSPQAPRAEPPARAAALPPALDVDLPPVAPRPAGRVLGLAAIAASGLAIMAVLATLGIFVLTTFLGFLLAFLAGPAVSELVVRLTARWREGQPARHVQVAAAIGMVVGALGALALGGLLLSAIGAPLPAEAVAMARRIGVGPSPSLVLLNNPGLLVFVSSAVAATVFRLR